MQNKQSDSFLEQNEFNKGFSQPDAETNEVLDQLHDDSLFGENNLDEEEMNEDTADNAPIVPRHSKALGHTGSPADLTSEDFTDAMEGNERFQDLMMMYRCAIREVQTKLEVLNDEFKTKSQRNPIDSIRSRIKTPKSIFEKLQRKGFPISLQSILDNLNDVAGIRVVCPFIDDIYAVAHMLMSQDDIEVMEVKDYICNPKANGYRSLHYVIIIPIFMSSGKEYMKVEVQIRTIAMNFWASLEHQMHYKQFADGNDIPELVEELTSCAETIYQTDVRMQEIRNNLYQDKSEKEQAQKTEK